MSNKREFKAPFFTLNPKSYLYSDEALALALYADELAIEFDIDLFFTAQHADIARIKQATKRLIVTAQHIDAIKPGRGMGKILPESVKSAGAEATFLNHAENPLTQAGLTKAIERANEVGLITIVCADSIHDAELIAHLKPDIIVAEQTELIGTGMTADEEYMRQSNQIIHRISPTTQVLQAAGISTEDDIRKAIRSGAGGTGGTSGIVCAKDPKATLLSMIKALVK